MVSRLSCATGPAFPGCYHLVAEAFDRAAGQETEGSRNEERIEGRLLRKDKRDPEDRNIRPCLPEEV